jgi:hypothetical protein
MAEIKTQPTEASVVKFLESVENDQKRKDSLEILEMMKEITSKEPVMWGDSIVGFDQYPYTNSRGEINHWPAIGFSSRKQSLTLYIMTGFDRFEHLMKKMGKHTTGKGCLYIKNLADVNKQVLHEIAEKSYQVMKEQKT